MCGVAWRDNTSGASVQEHYSQRLKWHGHVMTMNEEHIEEEWYMWTCHGKEDEEGQTERGKMLIREI